MRRASEAPAAPRPRPHGRHRQGHPLSEALPAPRPTVAAAPPCFSSSVSVAESRSMYFIYLICSLSPPLGHLGPERAKTSVSLFTVSPHSPKAVPGERGCERGRWSPRSLTATCLQTLPGPVLTETVCPLGCNPHENHPQEPEHHLQGNAHAPV